MTDYDDLCRRLVRGATKSFDVGAHLTKYQALCDEAATALSLLEKENVVLRAHIDLMTRNRDRDSVRIAELESRDE